MRKLILLSSLIWLLGSCAPAAAPAPVETSTPTPLPFFTATLLPTFTPRPSATVAPPTVAATIEPVEGTVSAQVNVRSGPGQTQTSLGLLNYGAKVRVIGKDSTGKWWQVIYPENSAATGWVTSAYVQVQNGDKIPVVSVAGSVSPTLPAPEMTDAPVATPVVIAPTPAGNTTTLTQTINVRSGPATMNASLGMLNANTTVTLTGRNEINTWIQIEYAGGPDGKGWVAALYVKDPNLNGLPIFDNQGQLLSSPTAAVPGQPKWTPTAFSPAAEDGDSEKIPAARLTFSPAGARLFTYSSDLSAPNGDAADWLTFTPYGPSNQSSYLYLDLDCTGNGGITATLEQGGLPVPDVQPLVCGIYDLAIKVVGGKEYMLILRADGSGSELRYVSYRLTLKVIHQ
jgi:uncharacterized protein YraI